MQGGVGFFRDSPIAIEFELQWAALVLSIALALSRAAEVAEVAARSRRLREKALRWRIKIFGSG